jgi:branched-chain amino acid transport system ATP-binding protein
VNVSGGYGDVSVVHDVNLQCPEHSVTVILGSNGAGKTTTLRLAMGLLRPMKGEVLFDGQSLTSISAHKRVEMGMCLIPEGRAIFPSLTVRDNLLLQAPANEATSRIADVTRAFPVLGERLFQRSGTLSGGEQRMLGLARAYMQRPKLVMVDEPSLGLAPIIVDRIFDFLRELAASGVSLVIVEQYVERALALADYAYVFARGRVESAGTAAEIRASGSLVELYTAK